MATGNDYLKARVATHLARMVKALDLVCHPDGRIALLNDSAFGIYNEPDQLRSFCKEMSGETDIDSSASSRCFALPDAGYYGWRDQVGNYIICDVGKIGPDYIPAHAHADMFSFELSLEGQRVIVDTGVHDYEISETRRFCRSTAAHNTLEIDGQDQCEMWASFRVARRGYPQDVQWKPSKSGFSLCGWHNGYRRLPGRPVHHRCIEWDREEGLRVTDRVTSTVPVKAMSRLHLHPECKVTLSQDDRVEVGFPGGQMEVVSLHGCRLLIEDGWYFPEFGIKAHIKVIALERTGRAIELAYRLRSIA